MLLSQGYRRISADTVVRYAGEFKRMSKEHPPDFPVMVRQIRAIMKNWLPPVQTLERQT
jgi:hypothetical protein